jgi:hypothetical protein
MSVQAQWSLDQSTQSAVSIARGIVQAATTDNVQVLAILACERFGATLAISPETRLKIERDVVPTPEPAVLSFLKVTVGYLSSDCVSQLGKSLAGVQFLALATALLTTMDHFSTASTIQAMVVDTAADKVLVPTVRQIKDLLESIEPKCLRSSFANDVAGWQIMLDPYFTHILRCIRISGCIIREFPQARAFKNWWMPFASSVVLAPPT